ncbi:MAG: 50S ribosomal protein L31e [Candidatus Pacearchaeota archaeon]|nr:50S ribosomal protein L31e [Candidatus Pacearchaeota archaeon]
MTAENIKPEKKETEEVKEIKKTEEKQTRPSVVELEEKPKASAEKTEKKEEKRVEKEFIIPLRRVFKKTASYKRVPKSIRAIKIFLVKHMKFYERDVNKVKLDKYLNEFIWTRGIKNPPSKVKIKAFVDGDFIRAELAELPQKLKFKKEKLERREKKGAAETPKKKEAEKQDVSEEAKEEKAEEKKLEKEKQASVIEAGQKMEKASAKQTKHQTKYPKQQKTQPRRMSLEK